MIFLIERLVAKQILFLVVLEVICNVELNYVAVGGRRGGAADVVDISTVN